MTRIYIAGPMSGLPDFNYPAFNAEAERLRALGYAVENPAQNPEPPCKSWAGYMRMAIPQMLTCEAIALLPGWMNSRGARIEWQLAIDMGMQIHMAADLVEVLPNLNAFHWKAKQSPERPPSAAKLKRPQMKPQRGSAFTAPITTVAQADRTNSIKGCT